MPSIDYVEEAIVVAPGEAKCPVFFPNNEFCEKLAFPHLFTRWLMAIKLKGIFNKVQIDNLIIGSWTTLRLLHPNVTIYYFQIH